MDTACSAVNFASEKVDFWTYMDSASAQLKLASGKVDDVENKLDSTN